MPLIGRVAGRYARLLERELGMRVALPVTTANPLFDTASAELVLHGVRAVGADVVVRSYCGPRARV